MRIVYIFAFWLALAFTLTMAFLPAPPQLPGTPTDKVQHIVAFAVLTLLAMSAYPDRWKTAILGLIVCGALIEIVQLLPLLNRSSDFADFRADALAVLITAMTTRALTRMRAAVAS